MHMLVFNGKKNKAHLHNVFTQRNNVKACK